MALALRTRADSAQAESLLREEFVRLHMPLAASVAFRGIATEDLRQVACLVVTKAALRFDPRSGSPSGVLPPHELRDGLP